VGVGGGGWGGVVGGWCGGGEGGGGAGGGGIYPSFWHSHGSEQEGPRGQCTASTPPDMGRPMVAYQLMCSGVRREALVSHRCQSSLIILNGSSGYTLGSSRE